MIKWIPTSRLSIKKSLSWQTKGYDGKPTQAAEVELFVKTLEGYAPSNPQPSTLHTKPYRGSSPIRKRPHP